VDTAPAVDFAMTRAPEIAANGETNEKTLRDYLVAAWRRRRAITVTAATGVLVTLGLAVGLPAKYQSSATILIEQQELPADLVRSTVTTYADQRVQVISQRVMTTQNLLRIIDQYDLYAADRRGETREALMEKMRRDIGLRMISADVIDPRSGTPREATIAFAVSYTSPSPEQAAKVANELTTLYLNENLTSRTRLANEATEFLRAEGDRLDREVAALEARLADFKQQNIETLPELAQLNLQLLDRSEQELYQTQSRLTSLQQQRTFLEAQLAQIKPHSMLLSDTGERIFGPADRLKVLRSKLASTRALYAADHPDVVRFEREVAGIEAQLGEAGAPQSRENEILRRLAGATGALAAARQRYSPEHPDVQRLERELSALESELSAARASPSRVAEVPESPDNPVYIQLRAQLSAAANDEQALLAQITRLRAQIGEYQRKVSVAPQIEREYRELARDYENAQLKYRETRAKQMEAVTAQNLETDRKGERFTLIEPPLAPQEPVSPNRPAILIVGLVLALALAAGAAALLESLDTTVRGRQDLVTLLDAPPLAAVPRIFTDADRLAARRRTHAAIGAAVAATLAAVAAIHFWYRPLDLLWLAALRRLGI
jgi:uncharacterized protein involved in exopolysaccharide biosynthesis